MIVDVFSAVAFGAAAHKQALLSKTGNIVWSRETFPLPEENEVNEE